MGAGFIERTGYPVLQGIETQTPGVWVDVTPANASKAGTFTNGNYGVQTIGFDPLTPGRAYCNFNCQGVWQSNNYGRTWEGPIDGGANEAEAVGAGCAGGITVGQGGRLYAGTIRGTNYGFWRSNNAGRSWTKYTISGLGGGRQDVYPPSINPYNQDHLLICGHEQDYVGKSTDGGQTWSTITMNAGMLAGAGTAFCFFVDTGSPSTTTDTWLWIAQTTGGTYGTWRTTNGGSSWTQVDTMEHPHGACQIWQPDSGGVVYMGGDNATGGNGVTRSTDYGATWTKVGANTSETIVWSTPTTVYSMYGWAIGTPSTLDPHYQTAPQPGTSWSNASAPAGMNDGGVAQVAVINDGARYIFLMANWHGGVWRYVE